jgi:hypothetical protein
MDYMPNMGMWNKDMPRKKAYFIDGAGLFSFVLGACM